MRVFMLGVVVAIAAIMPASTFGEDQQIADFIKARLMQEKQQGNLFGFNVDMRVDRGTVWFKGFVSNRSQELLILRTAQLAGHLGVVQVVDDIEINSPQGAPNAGQAQMNQQQQMMAMQQTQMQQPMQQMQQPMQPMQQQPLQNRVATRPGQTQYATGMPQQPQGQPSMQQMQQQMQNRAQQVQQSLVPPTQQHPALPPSVPQARPLGPVPTQPPAQLPPARRMNMPLSDAGETAEPFSLKAPKVDEVTKELDEKAQKVAYQEPIRSAPPSALMPTPTANRALRATQTSAMSAPPHPMAARPVASAPPLPFARAAAPPHPAAAGPNCQGGFCAGDYGSGGYAGGGYGGPAPSQAPGFGGGGGGPGIQSNSANLPGYAWPSYAASPNYGAVSYPKQYSPSAWPYIGPFYPYPQVPLGWRKVSLEWDDGWWFLDFNDKN